jgi:2-oxoglutarate ferredoxin oxidoreductase subunit beta
LLSTCPTNWGLTPLESLHWLEERMIPVFPIEDFKVSPVLSELRLK